MLSKTCSPKDLAERWCKKVDTVLSLIASGELIAINVAVNPRGGRPTWRITEEAIADFERSRSTHPTPAPAVRRRRKPTLEREYF